MEAPEKDEEKQKADLDSITDDDQGSEINIQKLITRLKVSSAEDYPQFCSFLEILDKEGIIDKVTKVVLESRFNPDKYPWIKKLPYFSREDELKAAYFIDLIGSILPERFIPKINPEIIKLKSKLNENLNSEDSSCSLFHLTSDKRLLRIIQSGFKGISENPLGTESTGQLEKKLGLDGIFFTYGREYDQHNKDSKQTRYSEDNNLVVFSNSVLSKDDTVCISGEMSYGYMCGMNRNKFMGEKLGLEKLQQVKVKDLSKEQIVMYTLFILLNAMEVITSPSEVKNSEEYEICANPQKLELPQMIIVEEEPEYFYEEAVHTKSDYARVPIISEDNVLKALQELGYEIDEHDVQIRSLFVDLVNKRKIDPMDWAVNK